MGIANRLKETKDAEAAAALIVGYDDQRMRQERFLRELTIKDGKHIYTHEHLRKARRSFSKLVHAGQLSAFMEMAQERGGMRASTNNAIEGRNARIREMHRLPTKTSEMMGYPRTTDWKSSGASPTYPLNTDGE